MGYPNFLHNAQKLMDYNINVLPRRSKTPGLGT